MDYKKMTAPCGLACFNCVVHLSKENPEMRERVGNQFDLAPEGIGCPGCRSTNGICPVIPEKCTVFPCSQEKGVDFCYECSDFPCDKLHPYVDKAASLPHNTKVFNLCLIKKMGLKRWAEDKAEKVKKTYIEGKWRM